MSGAYYNEIDPYAAQWLRNLIAAGCIAPGDVDERSIEDVIPNEIRGYTQHHFFAGIGIWSLALRRAGWGDDRPVITGSCPCQPFSAAGKGAGFVDERHLWPAFFHIIQALKPKRIYGEQVASADGLAWSDLVQTDLKGAGYQWGGSIYALRALARRTSDSDYSGWPTPTTTDAIRQPSMDFTTNNITLNHAAILSGWPTPTTRDYKDTGDMSQSMTRKDGKSRLDTLGRVVFGLNAGMERPGQLNPALSRWLQGIPIEWDACAPMETRSALMRLRK